MQAIESYRPTTNPTFGWEVERLTEAGRDATWLEITPEATLTVLVNGREVAALPFTPAAGREMALGFVISEGYVADFDAIRTARYTPPHANGRSIAGQVDVIADPAAVRMGSLRGLAQLLQACGSFDRDTLLLAGAPPALPDSPAQLAKDTLLRMAAELRDHQISYEQTRGIHAAGLFDFSGRLLAFYEDISRHNTVDKVIGRALSEGISLAESILLTTGRAGHKMTLKALRCRIPILASRSSSTSVAIHLAQALNLTLAGYLTRSQGYVYTHGQRIG